MMLFSLELARTAAIPALQLATTDATTVLVAALDLAPDVQVVVVAKDAPATAIHALVDYGA